MYYVYACAARVWPVSYLPLAWRKFQIRKMADHCAGSASGVVKHRQGKPLRSGEKRIILNVFNKLSERHPDLPVKDLYHLTEEFTGVSWWSVFNARKEQTETGTLSTPGKKENALLLYWICVTIS